MNQIGKPERATQNRVIQLFQNHLGYHYLGDWEEQERTLPIEKSILLSCLTQNYSANLANKAIEKLEQACANVGGGLYAANKAVYTFLRYGASVREEVGEAKQTVQFIDWQNPEDNNFALAEEVSIKRDKSNRTVRPDLVLYINGIAFGIIELKSSRKGIEEGIRQNIRNQEEAFVTKFFSTIQFTIAGNDTEGLRYGTIKTPDQYYLKWKEESDLEFDYLLDKHLSLLFNKERIIELMRDFVIFDKGVKKLCRPNQYFGIKAAQQRIDDREGGIIWHTQGSGKSLTMAWLAKWIRGNIDDSRVLIITDREELDEQIEKLFQGLEESIYRTKSGYDLIDSIKDKQKMLVCSLVHKFGAGNSTQTDSEYLKELQGQIGDDFYAPGNIYVFVDECHRTQSGKLHKAMKALLPDALFIGFTGTPLLKKDKEKSIEVFGPYIGEPYRFDEAVEDGVVLDLLYEARDVDQYITDQARIDEWFEAKTKNLTDIAKIELKKKWGTIQKVLGSKSRLTKIVNDIIHDFDLKPRLSSGEGNAMLVSSSVYQACKYYELFQQAGFKKCAIITSYEPGKADDRNEYTGGEGLTEELHKNEIYAQMLNGKSTEQFEEEAKEQFINEPANMKLLIVVDKLLTGFDAPSATYLYIDKSMQDHGLFQAICRVNRVADESKTYGYIVDYKDLFKSLQRSINDYTSGAFDEFDADDVNGLLKDRFEESRDRLETALEKVRAYCENVHPREEPAFIKYFCGNTEIPQDIKDREEIRLKLYKGVASLLRAYADVANEMDRLGYSEKEAKEIAEEVKFYKDLRDTIKRASGDAIDLKSYEPGMRQLMDMYIDASSSKKISNFENESLVDLIVNVSEPQEEYKPKNKEAVAETIENNVRKVINEERQTNPKYYDRMSALLDQLIQDRKKAVIDYTEYLDKVKKLARNIGDQESASSYPEAVNTSARKALYDNLDEDEELTITLDYVIKSNKLDGWRDGGIKEKKLGMAVYQILQDKEKTDELMEIIKAQNEY
ncbi:MAG: type I restriction endonuclease subunit R [Bacteroidota bacterium]